MTLKSTLSYIRRLARALNFKEKIFATVFLTVFLFSLFGIGLTVSESLTGSSGTVHAQTLYSEGLVGNVSLLNPLFVDFNTVDRDISRHIFSGLTKYDPLSKDFVADLATFTVNDDKTKYTFTLREGVSWHDGEPLSVEDILFTYKDVIQHKDFANTALSASFAGITIEQENENQVSFTLKEPNAFFITNTHVGILPKHIFKDVAVADLAKAKENLAPIGSGPYMFDQAPQLNDMETVLTLKRNDAYYGEIPQFEQIRFTIYPFQDDLIKNLSRFHGVAKLTDPSILGSDEDRFNLYEYSLPQYLAVFFNFDSPLMKAKNMRIAAMKAIDKEAIIADIPGKTIIDNPLLDLDQSEWYFTSSLEEAKGALYGLGWHIPDGTEEGESVARINDDAQPLVLRLITQEFTTGSTAQIEQAKLIELLKKQWLAAGIEVRDEYYILPELEARIKSRDYDMLLTGINMGYNLDIYAYWHSSQAKNGLNFSNFRSFEADALIENIRQNFDKGTSLDEDLKKLRKVIADDFPAAFLYSTHYYYAVDKNVQNVTIKNMAYPSDRFAYFDKWYINR